MDSFATVYMDGRSTKHKKKSSEWLLIAITAIYKSYIYDVPNKPQHFVRSGLRHNSNGLILQYTGTSDWQWQNAVYL